MTNSIYRWVLHSPYSDGTWRGIGKCYHEEDGSLVLYDTLQEAQEAIDTFRLQDYFIPVEVSLEIPDMKDKIYDECGICHQEIKPDYRCECSERGLR